MPGRGYGHDRNAARKELDRVHRITPTDRSRAVPGRTGITGGPTVTLPLSGVKVVEVANLIAGPYAAMLLADLGATVDKIEPPTGDLGRGFGPWVGDESAFFLSVNRGKRSHVVDFTTTDGRDLARRLVGDADVLVHNLRAGAIDRLGLGEDDVRSYNPSIVYAVASAFGADGPDATRAGIDIVFQAESGMISITGDEGDPPAKTATTIGDYVAATNLALGICAALAEPGRPGRRIDVSLRDSLMAVQGGWNALAFGTGEQPPRIGTRSIFTAPNQVFEASDGHIALAIVSDSHFRRLAEALGRDDLVERYPDNDDRMARSDDLAAELEEIFRTRTSGEWVAELGAAGLPVGRVLTLPEVWDQPQVRHNEMVLSYEHPTAGPVRSVGSPIRVDGRSATSPLPPPTLGGG